MSSNTQGHWKLKKKEESYSCNINCNVSRIDKLTQLMHLLLFCVLTVCNTCVSLSGKNVEETPIVIADSGNYNSLLEMCQKSRVVLNCVGPVSDLCCWFLCLCVGKIGSRVCMESC